MFVYCIKFENYESEYFTELYHHEKNAIARFNELRAEAQTKSEFESWSNPKTYRFSFSFFDSNYNEYSTSITLTRCDYASLFEDKT